MSMMPMTLEPRQPRVGCGRTTERTVKSKTVRFMDMVSANLVNNSITIWRARMEWNTHGIRLALWMNCTIFGKI